MSGVDLVLGIDCSTTAAKAVVWDCEGRALSMGRAPMKHTAPKPGWGEQDPVDWWRATSDAIGQACRQIAPSRLAAIAITHQRETFACLDEAGYALRPAMLWLDTRATAEVAEHGSEEVHRITGKPPNTATSWYKLLWLKSRERKVLESAHKVVDVHTYLVNRLTGEWQTSYGSVDPLGVLDLETFELHGGLIDALGLQKHHFGEVHAPGTVVGALRANVAEDLGLNPGLPVVAGLGDGQSAGLGVGIVRPGQAYLNLGTGIVSGSFAADYRTDRSFRTMAGGLPGSYLTETFFGGGTYNITWFVDRFSDIPSGAFGLGVIPEQILESAAAGLPIGADGLIALPYLTGSLTPYWDSNARGVFFGLTGRHGKAHVYRAILEGLSMEQRLSTTGAEAATGSVTKTFRIMGGGSRSPLWCQMLADMLHRPVEVASEPEATCLGAAMLAASATGLHDGIAEAAEAMSHAGRLYEPDPVAGDKYDRVFDVYKDIYPALRDHFRRLKDVANDIA
ncbi:xylulokinase [Paracoccus isoporae]|uniref:Xylulokinase n=1 Tax=Paracoccus isoporae TaxID=591205 RepID=A0A1G7H591_9RHOB|nr:FGGY family carbohydrate kinase [Paracoccus isoporae]SDE95434.1 xylulokinase [Paracoccus isoporae]